MVPDGLFSDEVNNQNDKVNNAGGEGTPSRREPLGNTIKELENEDDD